MTDIYYVTDDSAAWLLSLEEDHEDGSFFWLTYEEAVLLACQYGGTVKTTKIDITRMSDIMNFFAPYFHGHTENATPIDQYGIQETLF